MSIVARQSIGVSSKIVGIFVSLSSSVNIVFEVLSRVAANDHPSGCSQQLLCKLNKFVGIWGDS